MRQAGNPRKLIDVMCHENRLVSQSDGGDQEVVRTDRFADAEEGRADSAVMVGARIIERQADERVEESDEMGQVLGLSGAAMDAVQEFRLDDRTESDLVRSVFAKPVGQGGVTIVQDGDASIRIEEVDHQDSRSSSRG